MLEDLQPGDVILVRSRGLVGALIRFGERTRYAGWPHALGWLARRIVRTAPPDLPGDPWFVSHAAVCIGDGQLIEALGRGLTLGEVEKYDRPGVLAARLANVHPTVTEPERAAAVFFAQAQLGRHDRYGWLSIASIILQLLTPTRLDVSWDGALICSAFAAQCWEHAGVTLPTRSALTTMPADLAAMTARTRV